MRILFVGCVESSYRFLKRLLEAKADIVGVITKEKSDFNSDFMDLAPICEEYQIPYQYVHNVNEDASISFLKKCAPDIVFCFGWSQLIHERFLREAPLGGIGFHPAKLPCNRGRHPVIWALVLGLTETASTFFMMEEQADAGAIVSQKEIPIAYEDDARSLGDKIMDVAEQQVIELWKQLEEGTVTKMEQKLETGNVWRKRGQKDGEIDWRMSSRSIYNLVRGLSHPYVGAHFKYGEREIKVWKVREIITEQYRNIEPGKVLSIDTSGNICVKAGENVIQILESDEVSIKPGEYL